MSYASIARRFAVGKSTVLRVLDGQSWADATGAVSLRGSRQRQSTAVPGEANPAAKLTSDRVREVRAALASGKSQRAVARDFGVSQRAIWGIANGDAWKSVE